MSAIIDITEPWAGHSGLEVETWLKSMLASTVASLGGKIGYVELVGLTLNFYDEQGGTLISTVQLGGDVYTIDLVTNLPQVFFVLRDETEKIMTLTPSTTVAPFGSSDSQPFPEAYTYIIAVNNGSGYVPRATGSISPGGTASVDIRPFLSTGDNYIRATVTGETSGQVRTSVFTGTLTTLTMSVSHTWQTVWHEGEDYVLNGIRFSGNLVKTLHVSVDGTELTPATYTSNQSYTTTATTYTMPASAFPATENGTHEVKLWMTAQGVSTPEFVYYIMCAAEGDTTPMVTINSPVTQAVNWTTGRLFSYAVYGADKAEFNLSAVLGAETYAVGSSAVQDLVEGVQYDFAYALEIDTGINETKTGTLTAVATAFLGATEGAEATITTALDNTYSYLATPGALFYMNASTRSNSQANRSSIVNEMGASQDGNFAASYNGTWTGFSWNGDAWDSDIVSVNGRDTAIPALCIPAGCSLSVPDFAPLGLLGSYQDGLTFEVMIKNKYPADYDTPVLTLASTGSTPSGILIYPTRIVAYGTYERSEVNQTVNISENQMTHLTVTFVKNYEGISGRNLVSIYVNGISNINFAFDTSTNFANGALVIGQQDTDVFVYRMRVYGSALDSQAVFNNFLNSVIDGLEFSRRERSVKNDIFEGDNVDYDRVKAAGFNIMVIKMTDDSTYLPSIDHPAPSDGWPNCTMRFEYGDDPTKNVTVSGISIDGQGTTSKKYYRWNIRGKTKSSTTWEYGDGTTATGKKGKFINDNNYVKVDRITAKKNYASSMQGHKMGFTGLYNDLYKQVGLGSHLPDSDFRVAVYQFPFVGFRYYEANNSYEYIGLYTAGPDKGSKVTFGYSDDYPNLMSIEGPNHSPRGTRFLHPWVDVTYSVEDESLFIGGVEAWDADFVNYETSDEGTQADWDAILALYEAEWRPAYECVYNNSPHIASVAEVIAAVNDASITSLADVLNPDNAEKIIGVTISGMLVPIQNIAIYDTSYELYFYRETTKTIVSLASVDSNLEHNVLTALSGYLSTQTPTTAQIIAARAARFKTVAPTFWDMDQTLFHACFRELYAVSDNDAKNSYPFKFIGFNEDLPAGANINCKRWGWRQDDMDTVMMTDNNGNNTKSYSVEPGDTIGANRDQIFQGFNSALWVLVRDNYADELRTMMISIVNAASALATSYGVAGDGLHDSLFNLTSYYCWDHSAKYFSELLYETDRRWSYIQPWLENPGATYNGVPPLTQALGNQYQAERLWMERRIAYIFSKYRIGAFNGATEGYHEIAFTLASMFTFNIKPAIDLYPTAATGSTTVRAGRTQAGTIAQITLTTTGDTTNYIKGGDWLADLGDLAGMALSARGGGDIAFNLNCARLKTLKIGDADASNVDFNADTFSISSPSITSIDARNTPTIRNLVNLSACPRLRTVLFEGSGATGMLLPIGAKVTVVSFPSSAKNVYLQSLPFLEAENLTLPTLTNIESLYVYNCAHLNPFGILVAVFGTTGNKLANVTAIWPQTIEVDAETLELLTDMTSLEGSVVYENGAYINVTGKPAIEGTLRVVETIGMDVFDEIKVISDEDIESGWKRALSNLFESPLYIEYNPSDVNIIFVDTNVKSICVTNWDTDGNGELSMQEALAVTAINSSPFTNNTSITSFDELKYFKNIINYDNAFTGCSSLRKITFPEGIKFQENNFYRVMRNCASLEDLDISDAVRSGNRMDYNSYLFDSIPSLTTLRAKSIESLIGFMPTTTFYGACTPFYYNSDTHYVYIDGVELRDCVIPDTVTSIRPGSFYRFNRMTSVTIPSSVTSIGASAFYQCTGLTGTLTIPSSVTSIGGSAFANTPNTMDFSYAPDSFDYSQHTTSAILNNSAVRNVYIKANISGHFCANNAYFGGGSGIFYLDGSIMSSSTNPVNYRFKDIVITGDATSNATNRYIIQNEGSYVETLRIGGNISASYALASMSTTGSFKFLEIGGTTSGSACSAIPNGTIVHLGYNGIAGTPTSVITSSYISRVSAFYVGDGSSATHDDAILAQYLADTDWATYSAKLDTWYNYVQGGGEYATPPTIPTE